MPYLIYFVDYLQKSKIIARSTVNSLVEAQSVQQDLIKTFLIEEDGSKKAEITLKNMLNDELLLSQKADGYHLIRRTSDFKIEIWKKTTDTISGLIYGTRKISKPALVGYFDILEIPRISSETEQETTKVKWKKSNTPENKKLIDELNTLCGRGIFNILHKPMIQCTTESKTSIGIGSKIGVFEPIGAREALHKELLATIGLTPEITIRELPDDTVEITVPKLKIKSKSD